MGQFIKVPDHGIFLVFFLFLHEYVKKLDSKTLVILNIDNITAAELILSIWLGRKWLLGRKISQPWNLNKECHILK